MALNRKYANLPDLDSAPDIYETPELTEDNSTILTGTARSAPSSVSDYQEFDDESESGGISRTRLHPDEARSIFEPARIDARGVDFSDRVNGKRKSYKASSRRHRQRADGTEELGDLSDEEDGESLERKLARLRREVEEVKEEIAQRQAARENEGAQPTEEEASFEDAASLSKALDTLTLDDQRDAGLRARSQLARALQVGQLKTSPPAADAPPDAPANATSFTLTYAPAFEQSHALAKAADFDSRLVLLERLLGLNSTVTPVLDSNGNPRPILPTLDRLQRQIGTLTDSSASSLDAISRRVRTLTQEAERLEEARRSAKEAREALQSTAGESGTLSVTEDDEQISKINALYGLLPTIENLSPLLPPLLDRLRSLRTIHADAGTASENLNKIEQQQLDMAADIKKWREGLARVEEAMKQGESTMNGNMKVVEGWVKDLEERLSKTA